MRTVRQTTEYREYLAAEEKQRQEALRINEQPTRTNFLENVDPELPSGLARWTDDALMKLSDRSKALLQEASAAAYQAFTKQCSSEIDAVEFSPQPLQKYMISNNLNSTEPHIYAAAFRRLVALDIFKPKPVAVEKPEPTLKPPTHGE